MYNTLSVFAAGGLYAYGGGPYQDATFRTLGMVATSTSGYGDMLYITYTDATVLGGASPVIVGPVTVAVDDTPATLATKLAAMINGNSTLSGNGMTALASGNYVEEFSTHSSTSYSSSTSSGAVETMYTPSGAGTYQSTSITMNPSAPLTFYLFDTQATYTGSSSVPSLSNPSLPSTSDIGFTPHNIPPSTLYDWTVLFEQDGEGTPKTIQHFGGVSAVTMHELGHQLDYLYSSQGVLSGTNNFASQSTWATAALAADWAAINPTGASPCAFNVTAMGVTWEVTGIFSYLQDQDGNYICATETDSSYGFYDPLGLTSGNGHTLADYSGDGGPNYSALSSIPKVVYLAFSDFLATLATYPTPGQTSTPDVSTVAHSQHEIFAENFKGW